MLVVLQHPYRHYHLSYFCLLLFMLCAHSQAVRDHKHVHVFDRPGESDLTAWVDFSALRATVQRCVGLLGYQVNAQPLITQSHLLRELHIAKRLEKVLEGKEHDSATYDAIMSAAVRIVDPEQMGKHFKVFCVTSSKAPMAKEIYPFDFPDPLLKKSEVEAEAAPTAPTAATIVSTPTPEAPTTFSTKSTDDSVDARAEKEKANVARRFRLAQAVKQRSSKS